VFNLNSLLAAFLLGGAICLLGQMVMDLTPPFVTPGHVMVGYVTLGAVISALGWYQPLIDLGGAGATIPLSGFGHSLAQGAIEGARQSGVLGAMGGGAQATSVGIVAAVVFGYIAAVLFNPKG
jgi:stage V sporulation protein AE